MIYAIFCTVLILQFFEQGNSSKKLQCPPQDSMEFCKCHSESGKKGVTTIVCQSVPSREQLRREVEALTGGLIEQFFVGNSELGYLPGNMFEGTQINRLEITSTPLTDLAGSTEEVLVGPRDTLRELVLHYCKLTNKVGWYRLQKMVKLQSLDLSFNPLEEVLEDTFSHPPPKLKQLYLKSCGIKFLSNDAFASMSQLTVLDLSENFIVQIIRSMFPQPVNLLQYLYLSFNRIKELPPGVFFNMTDLRTVYADSNGLRHLPENVWGEVWNNATRTVDLFGNNLQCDVGMCWLTFRAATFLRGSCSDPDVLRGRRLLTLWPWEVHCNKSMYHGDLSLPRKPSF